MRAWITADDYGASPGHNRAIEELAEAGAVDAVSVMVHRDAHLGSLDRLLRSGAAIGLHLVLTRERPLHAAAACAGERLSPGYGPLFLEVIRRPRYVEDLAAEARAQVERLLSLGAAIDFVNSHEHVHLFPPLWALAEAARRRASARALRAALGQRIDATAAGLLAASSRLCWAMAPLPGAHVLSPLGVTLAGRLTLSAIDALLDRPFEEADDRTLELCFHPSEEAPGRGEAELLRSGEVARLLERRARRSPRRC